MAARAAGLGSGAARNVYDVIVVGGGHAGCEAAAAAARVGARTLLLTQRLSTIGEMSCNPSIGGIGKGQLVREIDALDGLMGRVADHAGIQFRLLNRKKGPAVHGPRAQMDRVLYREKMQGELRATPNLTLCAGTVNDLSLDTNGEVDGLSVSGTDGIISARQVILTTGTFLRGIIHRGRETTPAGRAGDEPSVGLALTLEKLQFPLGRLKTGTPPRLIGSTIDWNMALRQPGDEQLQPFSFLHTPGQPASGSALASLAVEDPSGSGQLDCASVRSTHEGHEIIRQAVASGKAPWFETSGLDGQDGAGVGPRYCMSIETKVRRFPERTHHIWLEPEGLPQHTDVVYPSGISTGLPADVQLAFLRTIPGLEQVEIAAGHSGYCIEYDYVAPQQLLPTLESSLCPGLYFAGQINGTTGYEEAAAQGLIAGANAALAARSSRSGGGKESFVIPRSEAFMGVLVDDLQRLGADEPYRMFTSRAEYRLSLRHDNADRRMTLESDAQSLGIITTSERVAIATERWATIERGIAALEGTVLTPQRWGELGVKVAHDGKMRSAADILSRSQLSLDALQVALGKQLPSCSRESSLPPHSSLAATVETECKYAKYIEAQAREIKALAADESVPLPSSLWPCMNRDWAQALKLEVREKLDSATPPTLGAAGRLQGMTPAALVAIRMRAKVERARINKQQPEQQEQEATDWKQQLR